MVESLAVSGVTMVSEMVTEVGICDDMIYYYYYYRVLSKIKKTIYNHIWAANGKAYWIKKLGIHHIYAHLIDWEVVRKASKMCNDQKRKRRIKHMANIGPVGKVMFRRKEREDPQCPKCQEDETNMHVAQCRGADSDEVFTTTIQPCVLDSSKNAGLNIWQILDQWERS